MAEVANAIESPPARLPHRLAVLAVCLIWPLIWVGGLVTTYDAGMAVPDWPNTYGYNLFLYPYETWLFGPFDLFIEHGHRLLGAIVGLVAIGITVSAWVNDPRGWVARFAIVILVAVCFQGALGGIRVIQASRTLAMVHGCFGPAFFATCVAFAVVTSRRWWNASQRTDSGKVTRAMVWMMGFVVALSYGQLVLGAQLRHILPQSKPGGFVLIVAVHIMTAFFLWLFVAQTWSRLRRCGDLTLSRPGLWLVGLVAVQIALGVGTWIANYGWPEFLQVMPGSTGFLIQDKGFGESLVITAHVATGSLILAISTMIWVRVWRDWHVQTIARDVATESRETTSKSSTELSPANAV